MKISLNWIRDFVDIDPELSTEELAQTITLSVCEVEGAEDTGKHLKDVRVAEVLTIDQHPNADKLSLVTVNYGEELQVVCGAKNFKVGDKVPFVGVGAELPGGFKIKPTKIRGVPSSGMLCAEDELGFSEDHEGLMILPADAEVGMTLDKLFPDQVDTILEIDNKSITNRPDLWGHYGFARELGTIFKKPVKPMEFDTAKVTGEGEGIINLEVEPGELVPRFTGLSVANVTVLDSPLKVQHRLSRVGLRPLNNLVDLTNYVMLELGQPMHAFDAEKIAGKKLVVKRAEPGTKVMTLYDKEAELSEENLTICDDNGASVVAGVIGGMDSGVNDETTSIFLEAANWNPVSVRKTSSTIGIRTDSSQRFEKSLDPEMCHLAIQRAVELLAESCPDAQARGELIDVRGKDIPAITIKTSIDFICSRLGKKIESSEIRDILSRLGFVLNGEDSDLSVEVPSWRRTKDVSIPEDLVEEIGRIHGFNNIEPIAPLFPIEKPVFNEQRRFETAAKALLRKNGFHEVYNYPLTCKKTEEPFELSQEGVMILRNPVADHQNQMRTSMLPHFVQTVHDNQKIAMDFRIFEIGRTYKKLESGAIWEAQRLITAISQPQRKVGDTFYLLKSKLLKLFSRMQIADIVFKAMDEESQAFYHHKNISAAIYSNNKKLGIIYSFSPQARDQFELKGDVCFAELDFDALFDIEKREYKYEEPAKFPPVYFELSIMVPERLCFQQIKELVLAMDKRISKVDFLGDYYSDEYEGLKSLSFAMEFQPKDKTMEPEEIKNLQDKIIKKLAEHGYNLR